MYLVARLLPGDVPEALTGISPTGRTRPAVLGRADIG
jgi:hypothetical protein